MGWGGLDAGVAVRIAVSLTGEVRLGQRYGSGVRGGVEVGVG